MENGRLNKTMSIFDKYISVSDIFYIFAIMPFVGIIILMTQGQIAANVDSMSIAFGAAGTVAMGLIAIGQKMNAPQPICTKMDCTNRTPTLTEQGFK